ncbi:MAG TPA: hypothetical protein VNQ34_06270 [Xanthobacteraceae bacterium]|nr:hypothetical protein [Xanthobacteraceae bacterium]
MTEENAERQHSCAEKFNCSSHLGRQQILRYECWTAEAANIVSDIFDARFRADRGAGAQSGAALIDFNLAIPMT